MQLDLFAEAPPLPVQKPGGKVDNTPLSGAVENAGNKISPFSKHTNSAVPQALTESESHEKGANLHTTHTQVLDPWMVKTLRRISDGQEHDRPPLSWVRARRMQSMGLLTIHQFRHRWMGGLTITEKGLAALREVRA